ncbi:hypothetical protein LVQ78_23840 [Buttiauxella sp. A2-C2_NF]|uniref:hypothetical protein n=1 Tax=Buttiauxella ferragutiae TaxID=82989 RepID=UPI001E4CA3CE|nr:hypothetical protein [Buttiauxella ferragutiae]MCE0829018.1 hypothetical protein [Buttiauxella ferragutiae]
MAAYSISELEPVANNTQLHEDNLIKGILAGVIYALTVEKPSSGSDKSGVKPTVPSTAGKTRTSAIDDIVNREAQAAKGGTARAQKYSDNWPTGNLDAAIKKFAGSDPVVTTTDKGKRIYTNPQTGVQVVEDTSGSYFRIYDPNLSGKRVYMDLDGNIPNNKILDNGKQSGRTQGEYNEATHFNIDRNK